MARLFYSLDLHLRAMSTSPKTERVEDHEDYRLKLARESETWTLSSDVEKKKEAVNAARSLPQFLGGVKLRNKLMKDVTLAELNKKTNF